MSNQEQPRECPHCGSGKVGLTARGNPNLRKNFYSVTCHRCEAHGPLLTGNETESLANALSAWNRRASPWRDIAEAPKDGTEVLGLIGKRIRIVQFHTDTNHWHIVPGAWVTEPTHFMPLPEPPEPKGEK